MSYYLIQFTWGLLENIIGFLVFLVFVSNKHFMYEKTFATKVNLGANGSFSIGNFIFLNDDSTYTKKHERGHCLQNLYWGIFSPIFFKIPSVLHYWLCAIRSNWSYYYDFYPERYANYLGGNKE